MATRQLLQHFDRLFRLVRPSQCRSTSQFSRMVSGVVGRHVLQFLNCQLVLADVFQQVRRQQQIVDVIGAQVARDARIQQHIIVTGAFVAQHSREGKEHFGDTRLGIRDLGKGDLPVPLQGRDQIIQFRVTVGTKTVG